MILQLLPIFLLWSTIDGHHGEFGIGHDKTEFIGTDKDKSNLKLSDFEHLIDHVNSIPGNTWTAGRSSFAADTRMSELASSRCGLLDKVENIKSSENGEAHDSEQNEENDDLPTEYDARKKYPKCKGLQSIKDQANCGSCWAVGLAAALSDRFCIKSGGRLNFNLSANHFAACSQHNYGCKGGYMDKAWNFTKEYGLITGGDYESDEGSKPYRLRVPLLKGTINADPNDNQDITIAIIPTRGCQPYTIRPCGYVDTLPCAQSLANTPKCKDTRCNNEYYKSKNENRKYKVSTYYAVKANEDSIKREIYQNGPVSAGFVVYYDFFFYKSGIYQRRSWWEAGRHAVKILGWGVDKGVKYWLVANSWSRRWGENGFFRIKRGNNECYIESMIHGGTPILN